MSKWHKNKWQDKGRIAAAGTAAALELLLAELNPGQRRKLEGNERVAELLRLYGVAADA